MSLEKNQLFTLTVDGFGQDAQGVCRADGMAVFVPGALPGEQVRVRIVKPMKNYAFGRLEAVLEPSAERAEAVCPSYKRCGGCVAQHMTYEASLEMKRVQVRDLLQRVGGVKIDVPPVMGMDEPWHYRNKGSYPIGFVDGQVNAGFYAQRSHELVALPEDGCPIQQGDSYAAVKACISYMRTYGVQPYDEKRHEGLVRHVMTRTTSDGQTMVVLAINGQRLPHEEQLIDTLKGSVPGLRSVIVSVNTKQTNVILGTSLRTIYGEAVLEDKLCGLTFEVSALSFFQVNPKQTEKLYDLAIDFAGLDESQTVVDAYCGAGTISLLLAQHAKSVVGIEIVPEAIADAKRNAARNGISNARFICGASEDVLPRLQKEGMKPDVVVVDPPRKGCDEKLLATLSLVKPERIVYVSCNPATLARDVARLVEGGFKLERVACVDMFCWTGGVETVVLMTRKNP